MELSLRVHSRLKAMMNFGLIYMYGDPHYQNTTNIWSQVQAFVAKYPNLPMLDLNNIMNANEKLGPRPSMLDIFPISVAWLSNVV